MFQCRLNVELCSSRVGGIENLFKNCCNDIDLVTSEMVRGEQYCDRVVCLKFLTTFLHLKLSENCPNLKYLTDSTQLYTSMCILKFITQFIFK